MKKILCLLLALGILSGCGNTGTTDDQKQQTKMNIYTRDASSGTREAFTTVIGLGENLSKDAIEVNSNGDMATKIGNDVSGIGYVSLTTDFEANNLKPLSYEGVKPSSESTIDGSYQMQRPFAYTTRAKDNFDSDEKQQLIAAFLDYLMHSKEGLLTVQSAGGIVDLTNAVSWNELKANHPIVSQDNSAITIYTAGSTSVEKTVKSALESFVPLAGNFQFVMNQTGSSDGYKRVLGSEKDGANKADIGFASRNFKAEEDVSSAFSQGSYCLDAVVVVVNKANTIENVTKQQLFDIFSSAITFWEDVK